VKEEITYRFGGIERLIGRSPLEKLQSSHVLVVGVGGVGSWACEALVRSGIGKITLMDADDICITNTNRQLHTLQSTIGKPKVEVMKERLQSINPDCEVNAICDFLTEGNINEVLDQPFDFVFDAIDNVKLKCLMLIICRKRKLPLLMAGGAAGRVDPSQIKVANLEKSINDMLLMRVKKKLRREYGFTKEKTRFRTKCIFSSELAKYPDGEGGICEQKPEGNLKLDCHTGMGTATFITGVFGFMAASHIVRTLVEKE
jgi:tRNA A37 threonylcarbamoyladenosine dehydratase